ncbi:hypothetical protein KDH_79920 [Dictyobacter sp. S3.2.2.5]|uniref:Uncharacterized protein n=1 Tax=Dictyobacter halimunensis TaxID=3026934 RepID=A0ABQ6G5S8_9CHLR|nr:hypothetical protein KDH_79920 [Dictyobacter sp. S3.2.2.5]
MVHSPVVDHANRSEDGRVPIQSVQEQLVLDEEVIHRLSLSYVDDLCRNRNCCGQKLRRLSA